MCKNIGNGDVVFDIGSEEADISALIASWIGPGDGGICLFEPNDRVWSNIRAIFEANHLKKPLFTFHGFAGDENRNMGESEDPSEWPACSDGPLISDHDFCQLNERPDIPAIRLDDFTNATQLTPSIITIDVEGSELHVLSGAHDLLATEKPLIFCSVHPEFMKDQYDVDVQVLYDFMSAMGYRSKILAIDHETHVAFYHPHGRELRF